jgi:hypothetical protein
VIPLRLPSALDDLTIGAATVVQEAGGESFVGQLAVSWVIVTRATRRRASILDVVLAPFQFSCWNSESPTRRRLDEAPPAAWHRAFDAFSAAYFGHLVDPTDGASHYLNVDVVLAAAGKLPTWAADPTDPARVHEAKVTLREGRHTFLRVDG